MHYFICAGEPSGDLHAAKLIEEIKIADSGARFTFLGGDLMTSAAGCDPVIHYSRMAFMGFSEVLRNLRTIGSNITLAKKALEDSGADCFIAVDYPGFNLKLAKFAFSKGIPVYWYISPKVWAWKEYRVKSLRKYVRKMLCILPFEVEFYRKHRMEAMYVGNPSLEEIDARLREAPSKEQFCRQHCLDPGLPVLALVPGSRKGEIRNNLPIMAQVAEKHPELQAVIAGAPGRTAADYTGAGEIPVVSGCTFDLMAIADEALVTSGTATLECTLAGTPQVVCYRANGSRLSYNLMKMILKIPFVSLPNLIAGKKVISEMLVHLCTVDGVDEELTKILPGTPGRARMLEGYAEIRARLGEHGAAQRAAEVITTDLKRK
ncbi:MAG: lipid-A-disaccharide synthase [Paramuribaculum sp.]|nr:lipid-A-disaccharide synthase [Paramuribaculum sp.]